MSEKDTKLLILGAGGFGQSIAEIAILLGHWSTIYFVDDIWPMCSKVKNFEIISDVKNLENLDLSNFQAVVAVGNNKLREQWHGFLEKLKVPLATMIHPQAWISPSAQLGHGVIIMGGCVIGASARVSNGVILNLGVLLDHDVEIGQYSHLSLGVKIVSGKKVEDFSFLEAGTILGH